MTHIDRGTIDYKDELVRKSIHLTSLSIPIIYYFIPKSIALIILGTLTALAMILDLTRYFSPQVGKIFYKIFGFMLFIFSEVHYYKKRNLIRHAKHAILPINLQP